MELCYEGGLVMPSSYAMMDEEEMTYVEGGHSISTWIVGALIDTACALMGIWHVSAIGWVLSKGVAKLCSLLTKNCGRALTELIGNGFLGFALSKMGALGYALGLTSIGGVISTLWDAFDHSLDGKIRLPF